MISVFTVAHRGLSNPTERWGHSGELFGGTQVVDCSTEDGRIDVTIKRDTHSAELKRNYCGTFHWLAQTAPMFRFSILEDRRSPRRND